MSNYDEVLKDIDISDLLDVSCVSFQDDCSVKASGLSWNPISDCFYFWYLEKPTEFSKHSILSIIFRIFDSLGFNIFPPNYSCKSCGFVNWNGTPPLPKYLLDV